MDRYHFSKKEKEVVNLSASIAAGCLPCTKFHVKKCKEAGLSVKDIDYIIDKIEKTCNRATSAMVKNASDSDLNIFKESIMEDINIDNNTETLIGITVSYIMNNTFLFNLYSSLSDMTDTTTLKISEIINISKPISIKARIHMELLTEKKDITEPGQYQSDCSSKCNC